MRSLCLGRYLLDRYDAQAAFVALCAMRAPLCALEWLTQACMLHCCCNLPPLRMLDLAPACCHGNLRLAQGQPRAMPTRTLLWALQ